MRTTIELDEDLVAEAQRVTGLRTNRGLIDHALRELLGVGSNAGCWSFAGG